MKFGAYLSGDPRLARDEARTLAAVGATAWMGEVPGVGWADPFTCLALAAQEGVAIGTALNPLGLRHPATLAQQAGTLDLLAPGRVTLGVGAGGLSRLLLGLEPLRVNALRDEVARLAALLRGEAVDGEQPYAALPLLGSEAPPDIQLLVAAGGERTAAVGGELADGVLLAGEFDPERVRAIAAAGRKAGREAAPRVVLECGPLCVLEPGESLASERVVALVQPVITGYFLYFAAHGIGPDDVDPAIRPGYTRFFDDARRRHGSDPAAQRLGLARDRFGMRRPEHDALITPELVEAMTLTGSPEELERRLAALADAGVTEIVVLRSVGRSWHAGPAARELGRLAELVRDLPPSTNPQKECP